MADTDTEQRTQDIEDTGELLSAIKLFSWDRMRGKDDLLRWFEKRVETLRDAHGRRIAWSTEDPLFAQALHEFILTHGHVLTDANKEGDTSQILPSVVTQETAEGLKELHGRQVKKARAFAHALTENFIDQTNKKLVQQGLPALSEDKINVFIAQKTPIIEEAISKADGHERATGEIARYLEGTLAFMPETQRFVESDQARTVAQELLEQRAKELSHLYDMETLGREALTVEAENPEFLRVATALSESNTALPINEVMYQARKMAPLVQLANTSVAPDESISSVRAGSFINVFAQNGFQKIVAPVVSSLLPPQTRDAIVEAISLHAWEGAIDRVMRGTAGFAINTGMLQDAINQGNKSFGGASKGTSSLQRVASDFLSTMFGSPQEQMADWLKLNALNKLRPGDKKLFSEKNMAQEWLGEGLARVESTQLLLTFLFAKDPTFFHIEPSVKQEAGGFLRWILHLGLDEAGGVLFKKTAGAAVGVVKEGAKKGAASFFAGLLTKFGLSATADVVLAIIGTPIATAIKWAVQAVIWLGGFLWQPFVSAVKRFFGGEGLPFGIGPAIEGTRKYMQSIFGGVSAAQSRARWDDDLPKLLAWGAVIGVLLFMLPLSPFSNFTDMVRSAALITSLVDSTGFGTFNSSSIYPPGSVLLPDHIAVGSCPVVNGRITTGSYNAQTGTGHGSAGYWGAGGPSYEIPIRPMVPDPNEGCSNSSCPYYGFAIDVHAPNTGEHPPVALPQACDPTKNCDSLTWRVSRLWFNCAGDAKTYPGACNGAHWGWGAVLTASGNGHSWKIYLNHIDPRSGLAVGQTYKTGDVIGSMTSDLGADSHVHVEISIDGIPYRPEQMAMCS